MKKGMGRQGQTITGLDYLQQRLTDVVTTPLGSLVGARDFGSEWHLLIDRNVDSDFYMRAYMHLSNAINNPANGLDDFMLETMSIDMPAERNVTITFSGQLLDDGEPITVNNLVINA